MADLYQNREISTLAFNERVLQEAEDSRNPLLERLKFLGIFSSNMDEFYKVRVASIHRRIELGRNHMEGVVEFVDTKSRELDERFQRVYNNLITALRQAGLKVIGEAEMRRLSKNHQVWMKAYFDEHILQELVPIIINSKRTLPPLSDGALYLAIELKGEAETYAVLKVPVYLDRFVVLPNDSICYIDDLIRLYLQEIFYTFKPKEIGTWAFKVLRDAELDMDNDFSADYVRQMKEVLEKRKGGRPARLVYDKDMPEGILQILMKRLGLSKKDPVIGGGRYHTMKDLMRFPSTRPDLCFPLFMPAPHPLFDPVDKPMLDIVEKQDALITYPYQSFSHIVRLLREAAIDPKVDQIKMTLYRVAVRSQVVNALVNAARNGKKVFVSIELQARFDEKNNINIAEKLNRVGATVVFGIPPMKVHSKMLLIRRDGKYIAALSTGNFHENTGRHYVDSTLLTANPKITNEVNSALKYLKNASKMRVLKSPRFSHLFVSPFNFRRHLSLLIKEERAKGKEGYICIKANHVTDDRLKKLLLGAADAGVTIDLIIRTTYTLKPHENIRAISILDRFLEHQRVYIFGTGKGRKVYMGSSDLMERNMDFRMEIAFPIYDKAARKQVEEMIAIQLKGDCKARVYDAVQSNAYVGKGEGTFRTQWETAAYFERLAKE